MSGTRSAARRVLLATRSGGKLRELRPIFEQAGFAVVDLGEAGIAESPEEDGLETFDSFEENALAKARHFHALAGLPTVADDSGLAVDALGGRPGVLSKRFSGRSDLAGQALDDANNEKLAAELGGTPNRKARYVCVAAYVDGAREVVRRGETTGRILRVKSAGPEGFGYDPWFFSDDLGRSFADATREEKQAVSHRGRAFRALLDALATGT